MRSSFIFLISLTFIIGLSFHVYAGWQFYDDFDSGNIDPQKWHVDNSSANISIENGELKFLHKAGHPNDSSWLEIVDNPQNIFGIRCKIRIHSCTGDVRGRAGGWAGKLDNNEIWSATEARAYEGRIIIQTGYDTPSLEWFTLFFGALHYIWENPLDITGKHFTIEWIATPDKLSGEATEGINSYGEVVFKYPERLSPHESSFKGIGTRSTAGDGPCVIYFDDVEVYRQTPSAATNLLLLDE